MHHQVPGRGSSVSSLPPMSPSTQSPSPPTSLSQSSPSGWASSQVQARQASLWRALRGLRRKGKESSLNMAFSSATRGLKSLLLLLSPSTGWISVAEEDPLEEQQRWQKVQQLEQKTQARVNLDMQLEAHPTVAWRRRSSTTTARWPPMATTPTPATVGSRSFPRRKQENIL